MSRTCFQRIQFYVVGWLHLAMPFGERGSEHAVQYPSAFVLTCTSLWIHRLAGVRIGRQNVSCEQWAMQLLMR